MENIYSRYLERNGRNLLLENCIESTVNGFLNDKSNEDRPALMLGDIQSGKTRGFIGVMALAFDKGYNVAVVFTKGTKALVKQTVNRFSAEFQDCIDEDILQVYDIMGMPTLNAWTLDRQKVIIVVKKEKQNMRRLEEMFFDTAPKLMSKRVLIVDDEADFVSIGYRRVKNEEGDKETDINVISSQISNFRKNLINGSDYLQVTATPYSLYLQPQEIAVRGEQYKPMRPRFTQLLPIHERYIGSTYYFEHSEDEQSPASCIFHPVEESELLVIDDTHGAILNNVLRSAKVATFRTAIVNYITASCIRMIQDEKGGKKHYKSSFIIHTGTGNSTHTNQEELTVALIEALKAEAVSNTTLLEQLVTEAYEDISNSVGKTTFYLPDVQSVLRKVREYITYIGVRIINSKTDVTSLLNPRTGELKLTDPLNIFIGGQILDRGITIQNLIGFFYGRNPRRMQQDTVMQHCRIFGARIPEDMCVTRLYTTQRIYEAMKRMHQSDKALRATIEEHGPEQPVNFMRTDEKGRIILCSPNKLLMSNVVTLQASRRLMPYGMQTLAATYLKKKTAVITRKLTEWSNSESLRTPFFISADEAIGLVELSYQQFSEETPIAGCSVEEFVASIRYVSSQTELGPHRGQIAVFSTDAAREVSRIKSNRRGRMFNDSCHDGHTDTPIVANCIEFAPCLFIPLQAGKSENGWKGNSPFYWPVLFNPKSLKTTIFTTDTEDGDELLLTEEGQQYSDQAE
jgi:hypothetical protein